MSDSAPNDRRPFIPAWLDDARLTPGDFRIVCHVARRGNCFESLATMETKLQMRRRTIQLGLARLVKIGALAKEYRLGRTSVYTLPPITKEALGRSQTYYERGTTTQNERGTTHLLRKEHYKGTPSEVTTSKGGAPRVVQVRVQGWQLAKDIDRLKRLIHEEAERPKPNQELLAGYRTDLRALKAEVARRGQTNGSGTTRPAAPARNSKPLAAGRVLEKVLESPEVLKAGYQAMKRAVDSPEPEKIS